MLFSKTTGKICGMIHTNEFNSLCLYRKEMYRCQSEWEAIIYSFNVVCPD